MTLFTLLLTLSAPAEAVATKFCFEYNINLNDAAGIGDDYINNNATNYEARGAWVTVTRNGPGTVVLNNYIDDGIGGSPGCTSSLTLASGAHYTISITSKNQIHGNRIFFYDEDAAPDFYTYVADTNYIANVAGTVTYATPQTVWWSNAAAAAWALWHNDMDATNDLAVYVEDGCPGGGGVSSTCCSSGATYESVYVGSLAQKGLLAHNMGHCVAHGQGIGSTASYALAQAPCNQAAPSGSGHTIISKEWQGGNLWEGWAHFYWANAFNDSAQYTGTTQCYIRYYDTPLDWNADGDTSDAGENASIVNCSGGTNVEDDADYYWDYCFDSTFPYTNDDNTGTELDWLRHFWDFAWAGWYGTFSVQDTLDIIAYAEPGITTTTGYGSGAGYTYSEISDATNDLTGGAYPWDNLYMVWGTEAPYNGITQ